MPNQDPIPGWEFCIFMAISHYKSLELWGYRWICGAIVRLMGLSLELWVIVEFMRTNTANTQNRPLCYSVVP